MVPLASDRSVGVTGDVASDAPWTHAVKLEFLRDVAERANQYLDEANAGTLRVSRPASPAQLHAQFDEVISLRHLPRDGAAPDLLVALVDRIVEASVHTAHPRFLNQNFAGPDPIAVAGDWLGAALNTTGATYEMSPVFTLMEHAMLARLRAFAGWSALPSATAGGLMLPGGSYSNLLALHLARHRAAPEVNALGDDGRRWAVFTSSAAHYSIQKSARLMGLGDAAVYTVDCDADDAMKPDALRARLGAARADGRQPLMVNVTSGTTVRAAFDPIAPIAAIAREARVWCHVDGCFGASALLSPEHRGLLDGVEHADSLAWNLHKVMGMTQQCATLLLRDPAPLADCFSTGASYLFQDDKLEAGLDLGDLGFQCARRVDVLKAWLTWAALGDRGMTARVDAAVERCRTLAREVERRALARVRSRPPSVCELCVRWIPEDLRGADLQALDLSQRQRLHRLQRRLRAALVDSGEVMLAAQPLDDGVHALRILVMNPEVTANDLTGVLDQIEALGPRVDEGPHRDEK